MRENRLFPGAECCVKREIDAKLSEFARRFDRARKLASVERGKPFEQETCALSQAPLGKVVLANLSNRDVQLLSVGVEPIHGKATQKPASLFSGDNTTKVIPIIKKNPLVRKGLISLFSKKDINKSQNNSHAKDLA